MIRKIAVAAVVLFGTMSIAQAQGTMGHRSGGSPGASQFSPGHEMQKGGDSDDRGPGASGFSPGHEMKEHGTVGQSRGDRDDLKGDRDDRRSFDRDHDRDGRRDFDRDRDEHGTVGESRGEHEFDRDRGDRDRGASEFSPGHRMHDRDDVDRR
jgi:hypothetical protein